MFVLVISPLKAHKTDLLQLGTLFTKPGFRPPEELYVYGRLQPPQLVQVGL